MAIITLTTDMGLRDHYVASLKGAIYSQLPNVNIVDVSHSINSFNLLEAAFVLVNAYHNFPKHTIHILGVDTALSKHKKHVIVQANDHYFIGADNGIFSLMFPDVQQIQKIIELNISSQQSTFPTRNIFIPAACHLLQGGVVDTLGKVRLSNELFKLIIGDPVFDVNTQSLYGKIIYIDNFGNAITNITTQLFKTTFTNKPVEMAYKPRNNRSLPATCPFEKLVELYNDVEEGELIILPNSLGLIEIAMNKGNASEFFDLGANMQITFTPSKI